MRRLDRRQHEEHGAQIASATSHPIPLVLRHLEQRLDADDPRVVEEHVEPAPAPIRLLDHALDVLAPGDVGPDGHLAELCGDFLDAGIEISQHELRAVGDGAGAHTPRRSRARPR